MKFKFVFWLFVFGYLLLVIFSYGFVDANFPLKPPDPLSNLVYLHRPLTTAIFVALTALLLGLYVWVLRLAMTKKITSAQVWRLIFVGMMILLFSFPAFSYDIFNYLATAKVTFFYRENPYLVMPIEFVGEPMLKFTHAANKIALYGPAWILLTVVPHLAGLGNIVLTVFTFKAFVALFYLGASYLVWLISGRSVYALAFFAINPLVVIETLVSGHNDVVMMALALVSFYFLFQRRRFLGWLFLLASVGIKYATLVLAPLFIFSSRLKKETLITISCWLMFLVFLLSPLREEIYPWYFIWIIALAALVPKSRLLTWLVFGFTIGLLLRNLPWLYFRSWNPPTPLIKTLTTFIPPAVFLTIYFLKNVRRR